jgi:hypothetical protein
MNLMIKFFCFVLILGLAGLFVLKKPNGSPWLNTEDFIPNTQGITAMIQSLSNSIKKTPASDTTHTTSTQAISESGVYRWKDASGQWQFSDTPPENIQAEAMKVSGNLNSDLAEKYTPPEEAQEEHAINTTDPTISSSIPASLSPEKISTLMKDTQNIQKIMDERTSTIEKQLQ